MLEATKTQWSKIQAMAIARAFSLLGTELTIFTLVFREKDQGPAAIAALFIVGTLPMIIFPLGLERLLIASALGLLFQLHQ